MAVNIDNLTITTPLPKSASNPVALEVSGAQALATLSQVVARLPDGSIRMTAPTKGASSKSTHRTRCEWKEAIYWALGSATRHRNYQAMTLEKVNLAQKVVISQLHVKDDDNPPIKVFWNKGKLTVGLRTEFNQVASTTSTLLTDVPLGTPFDITIEVTGSGNCTISASSNGRLGTPATLQLESSWASRTFNFHGGVYNQVDYTEDTPADDASVCVIRRLELTHD